MKLRRECALFWRLQEIGPGTGVQEAIAHISRLLVQQAAATAAAAALSAGGAAADVAQQQRGGDGGSEAAERGDSSGSSEGDEVDLPQPSPSQQLPMRRQSTADAERGGLSPLQTAPTDPSAVLRSYALRCAVAPEPGKHVALYLAVRMRARGVNPGRRKLAPWHLGSTNPQVAGSRPARQPPHCAAA